MNAIGCIGIGSVLAIGALSGCGSVENDGPPSVRFGDSVCAECGMIVSDERFATSTIVVGDRGNQAMIFDDFNCQINFETKHAELVVVDRWSHDHGTNEWMHMADAWFVESEQLRTPMASNIASFLDKEHADAFAIPLDGTVVGFDTLWESR